MKRLYLFVLLLFVIMIPLSSQDNRRSIDIIRTLDSEGNVGWYTSIAIGTDGNPVVSYQDFTNGDLKLVACGEPTCDPTTNTTRTLDSAGDVDGFTSIAIGTDGNPVVSYFDGTNDNLKLVACGDPTCDPATNITRTLDSTGIVGIYTSIAIGTDGNPVVSYYDVTNADLKIVACGDPTCDPTTNITRTLDSGGLVGVNTSISIGGDGNPVVSYLDNTNADLKFIACGDPTCDPTTNTTRTLDSAGDVGYFTSIAISTDGNPVVSYYDLSNEDLKFIACDDSTCDPTTNIIRTVDSDGVVGRYTSISIGTDGNPLVSYFDQAASSLKLLTCGDPTCALATNTIHTVDAGGVGSFASVAIDADGVPVISYRDFTTNDLKFAYVDSLRPDTVTRVYPASGETLTTAMKSVLWGAVDGTEWYGIQVINTATNVAVIDGWVEGATACDAAGVCAVYADGPFIDFPAVINNGQYQVRYRTYDAETQTTSPFDTATAFTVAVPAPVAPTILAPQAIPTQPVTEIAWVLEPNALYYKVTITGSGDTLLDTWYYASDVCTGTRCSIEPPTLFAGVYTMTLTAWGPGVTGTNFPNTARGVTIADTVPMGITLTAPTGSITAGPTNLEWAENLHALWYRVTILNPRAGVVDERWVKGVEICEAGTCALPVGLVPGAYTVRIAGWGPAQEVGPFTASTFIVE